MPTITAEYAHLNQQLHAKRADYGCKSARHGPKVLSILRGYKADTVIDYGCGKGDLVRFLQKHGKKVVGYDPGHPDYTAKPSQPAALVTCTDVLEHIESDCLADLLTELRALSEKGLYLVIALRPDSSKLLPDGTNPHKIVQTLDDWLADFKDAWGKKFTVKIYKFLQDKQVEMLITWK
jgi:hypothetical protein